jgi:glutathione synthase
MLERSKAVKCPSISYHLTGTKKIQQVLAVPGVLEKFTVGMEVGAGTLLRLCFTGLYPVDEEMDRALLNPERYVMKPQREGGGNNLYDDQVKDALLTMTPEERQGYILMDRITPRPQVNWLVRAGQITETQVVSELGVYGVYVSQDTTVHLNSSGGHLLRTKAAETNEGGVAVGFAVMDSPRLY